MHEKIRCAAYLIRWQENEDKTHWRAVAENVYTGKKEHFTDRSMLLHFVWQCLNPDLMPGTTASQMRDEE